MLTTINDRHYQKNSNVLELQDYMKTKVKPIIEPIVSSLVNKRPNDPVLL